jgi:hypothetical protein
MRASRSTTSKTRFFHRTAFEARRQGLGGQPQLLGAASCVDDAEIRMKPKLNGGREMLTSR